MKLISRYLISGFVLIIFSFRGFSQNDSARRYRIAIFVPLYLDSAFDASGNYRYDKNFPKFINPGLEFYEGAQMALDSLENERVHLDVKIYDTRSVYQSVSQVVQSSEFQQTQLIFGHVTPADLHILASAAARLHVPFINVNFPNDGGITNNPEYVILNSTLKTHCESIYRYLQRNYALSEIVVFRKKGVQEDRIRNYFTDIEKNTASVPLKLKYVNLEEPVDLPHLVPHLDSSESNICIVGSMDENFGKMICSQLATVNKTYATKVFGMPTWDNITDFSQPEYADQEIYYTTPFYNNPADSLVVNIQQNFRNRFFSRPSDMVFRGYETVYHFSKLLQFYGNNFSGSLGEKKFRVFNDFDIEPVFLNRQNMTLDYFENKKIYFIKKVNGNIMAIY
jgi:hypothetical protein